MNKTISAADIVFPEDEPHLRPMAPAVTVAGIDMDAVIHDIWRSLGEGGRSTETSNSSMRSGS